MPKQFAESPEADVELVTPAETEPGAGTIDPTATDEEINRLERIRVTAYLFYEARGCIEGYALDDWLAAEADVMRAPARSS